MSDDTPLPADAPADVSDGAGACPVTGGRLPHPTRGSGNLTWWPDRLNLKLRTEPTKE